MQAWQNQQSALQDLKVTNGLPNDLLLSRSMLESKNSQCFAYCGVQADVSLAIWGNEDDHIVTDNKGMHTLSLYLQGGNNAYREDMKHLHGGPGKVCFMPANYSSEWHVDDPLRLLHLYFTESHLSYLGITAFDVDPRLLQLQDLTYSEDEYLIAGLRRLLLKMKNVDMTNKLFMQECQQDIILYLLTHYSQRSLSPVRGGLSSRSKSRVYDYINEYLDQDISLQQLADVACLSTYHFARMFKQSTGLPPYQYILKRRMEVAAEYLKKGDNLLSVALCCGYSSHSRFSRAFRGTYGVTPSEYQRLVYR